MSQINTSCPACGSTMEIRRYQCADCGTAVEGRFAGCQFCRLSSEQKEFVTTFIASRGNIKEVERELGISYPTVRARLDAISEVLGIRGDGVKADYDYGDVLSRIERGELSARKALDEIKGR